MNKEQMLQYAKDQIEEFTDSMGDLDGIALIEHLEKKFGLTPRDAESLLDDALGYDE